MDSEKMLEIRLYRWILMSGQGIDCIVQIVARGELGHDPVNDT
jgi:hypothetical protein